MQFIPPEHAKRLFGIASEDARARGVYVDDNSCANFTITSCFDVRRHNPSTQVCHIFPRLFSQDPRFFTALPNLVLVPAWLAKLTDSDASVPATLRWAVRLVYGFCPKWERPEKHECELCQRPLDAPRKEQVHKWLREYEGKRTKNFLLAADRPRDRRWLDAIEAGRGYSHVVLGPNTKRLDRLK